MEIVDGVPDDYLEARINVRPEWPKLLDFETTLPQAVEDVSRGRRPDR
jgi:hypothetical protein